MFKLSDKDAYIRLIGVLLALSVAFLVLSIFSQDSDGKRQILDEDGGREEQLCAILSSIEGAGQVEVMIEYDSKSQVSGVIVLAEGGGNPVVARNLTQGVATLYSIPVSGVIVFEKNTNESQS